MKTITSFFCLALVAAGFIGCSSSSAPTDAVTMQTLFPMSVGNTWTYLAIDHNASNPSDTTVGTIKVVGLGTYGSSTTYRIVNFDGDTSQFFFLNGGQELWAAQGQTSGGIQPYFAMRYPMPAGDSVVSSDTTYQGGYRYRELYYFRSKNAIINTGTRNYTCYQFESISTSSQSATDPLQVTGSDELYFAPGIGLVAERSYNYDNGVKSLSLEQYLQSYTVR
jgi:hypothetical protein